MRTILYAAARFDETRTEQSQTSQPRQASAYAFSCAATVWAFCSALFDGLTVYRHYEHLKSCGIQHDAALRYAVLHQPRHLTKNG